jgi:hypothetical protein
MYAICLKENVSDIIRVHNNTGLHIVNNLQDIINDKKDFDPGTYCIILLTYPDDNEDKRSCLEKEFFKNAFYLAVYNANENTAIPCKVTVIAEFTV